MNAIGGLSGRLVYAKSWQRALLTAVMLSWGMMQLLALLVERRTDLLHPSTQYTSFWYGDLICLPGLVLVFWKMSRALPGGTRYWQRGWWHGLCLVIGIEVGVIFHWILDANAYSEAQLVSPTKLWHDLIVYPAYVYLLGSAGIPCLLHSRWGLRGMRYFKAFVLCVAFGLFAGAFMGLLAYDGIHKAPKAHVPWSWSDFSTISSGNR